MKEDLVNTSIVKGWFRWGFFWAIVAPLIGIILSLKFNFPDFLSNEYLHFGRLRPVHVNGVILGLFSSLFFGLLYYMVPKLTGVRIHREEWSGYAIWLWNLSLVAGSISLLLGYNKGLEVAEFPNPVPAGFILSLLIITYQILVTISKRKEEKIYVSLWYIIAALVWTGLNLTFGNLILPYAGSGVSNAALHGLFIHYVVGLWVTPAGLSVIYFFLPASARAPLYSHKISLLGFWSLAFFYPFVGIHHYLLSPIPDWTETIAIVTSMMLIIPVWAVVTNFFGTLKGNWSKFQTDITVKLLIFGAVMYFIGSTQGSFEALRGLQKPTHFTDFVIAHAHATVFGGYIVFALGACYYVWKKINGDGSYNERIALWSTWMIMSGITGMVIVLSIQGLVQGTELITGAEFIDSLVTMKPYWLLRTITGITMDIGIALVAINLLRYGKKV